MKKLLTLILTAFLISTQAYAEEAAKPKYGNATTRLYQDRAYLKTAKAPDFWALMPYYLPQQNEKSCAVAAGAMVMNATRAKQKLGAADELVTEKNMLAKVKDVAWTDSIGDKGQGSSLDEMGNYMLEALHVYGFANAKVEVNHVDSSKAADKAKLHRDLVANEKSDDNFIIANFLQSEFTGDPEGAVGHFAPIGAYNAKDQKVLVLDPDRQWYEPYWISEDTFLKGMSTQDKGAHKNRGYLWIQLNAGK